MEAANNLRPLKQTSSEKSKNMFTEKWKHVNGEENPANTGSVYILPEEILIHKHWLNGPAWIKNGPTGWPSKCTLAHNMAYGH